MVINHSGLVVVNILKSGIEAPQLLNTITSAAIINIMVKTDADIFIFQFTNGIIGLKQPVGEWYIFFADCFSFIYVRLT